MKRQLVIISLLTATSQLAAFFKLWFTARIFGVGSELDGYNLALVLPTLIVGVISGALQTGFFPVRAKLAVEQNEAAVARFERSVLLGLLMFGTVLTVIIVSASPVVAAYIAKSATASVQSALKFVLPFAAILIVLNVVGDGLGYLLALRNRYPLAAGAPIANGLFGAVLLASWPEGGLLNLALGTVLGVALQVAICVVGLKQAGFSFIGSLPGWEEVKGGWNEMLRLGAWILPGVVFSNFVVSLPPIMAAQYDEGAVSAFGYAYRLHASAIQLLVMAGSAVILARFSELVVSNDYATIRRALAVTAKIAALIGLLAISFVWLLGPAMLEWIFGGRFDSTAAARVSQHWLWLTCGLPFAMLGNVFAKLWQAQKRPQLISVLAGISLASLLVAFSGLQTFFNEYALPAALSISALVVVAAGWMFTSLGGQRKS